MAIAALPPLPSTPVLPRRDPTARAHLDEVARRGSPLVLARERVLPVPGPLGAILPGAALQRGSVVTVEGATGSGATSLAFELAAAATAAGEWAVAVDRRGTLGGLAAGEGGVELSRFVVVRGVTDDRWSTVVAALIDGVSLVMADVPRGVRAADARRLVARARERGTVLVMISAAESASVVAPAWPADAALHLRAEGGAWSGLGSGGGVLETRALRVRVEGRGVATGVHTTSTSGGLARAG